MPTALHSELEAMVSPAAPMRPDILIVTPALSRARNGNWQTARRWARCLEPIARCRIATGYPTEGGARPAKAMIALHARRSAAAIEAFAATGQPIVLILTGTDLYHDIHVDEASRRSLDLADRIVVLQRDGLNQLSRAIARKTVVIHQSAPSLSPRPRRRRSFDLLLVAHLRPVKEPLTVARAMAHLPDPDLRVLQIGGALDDDIGRAFAGHAAVDPRIRMLGSLPHWRTRDWIRRGRVLVIPSSAEGGANVIIEAITCGTPVLASRIGSSVAMLGKRYPGYFEVGDDAGLARLIRRCRDEPRFLQALACACERRAPLFRPQAECEAISELVSALPGVGN